MVIGSPVHELEANFLGTSLKRKIVKNEKKQLCWDPSAGEPFKINEKKGYPLPNKIFDVSKNPDLNFFQSLPRYEHF